MGVYGAGDGNRTHATSLEGWDSTIELHPQSVTSSDKWYYTTNNMLCQAFFEIFYGLSGTVPKRLVLARLLRIMSVGGQERR